MTPALVLTILEGAGDGMVRRVTSPCRWIVGRGETADWRINDQFVSRHHILLEISPPACRLLDLGFEGNGSVNAPRVNSNPVRVCELRDGDVLDLGVTRIRVSIEWLPDERPRRETPPVKPKIPSAEPPRNIPVYCQSCRRQLSGPANSDGRAAALGGAVVYSCPACLPAGDEFAGRPVGPYELRRLLGEGGMGSVYLAYQHSTARLVALKRIDDVNDREAVRRFAREVQLLGSLAHPRVIRYVDSGVDQGGRPYIATEYMAGGNLEDYLRNYGRPSLPTAVDLTCRILEGIGYLHSWPVIHRDVKPENILLRLHDGLPSPVLADFGISRYYEQAGGTRLTKPGTRMGTLMFMPPEQVCDAAETAEPADTYAVGVMLYYLLTGRYTFEFPTPAQVREFQARAAAFRSPEQAVRDIIRLERVRHPFKIILEEEPVPVLMRVPTLPRRLAAVIDKSVRKDIAQRYRTASEFHAELSAALR